MRIGFEVFFFLHKPYVFCQFSNYICIYNHLDHLFKIHTPKPHYQKVCFCKSVVGARLFFFFNKQTGCLSCRPPIHHLSGTLPLINELLLSGPAPAHLVFLKMTTHLVGLDFPSSNTHVLCPGKSRSPGHTGRTAAAAGMPSSPHILHAHLPMLNPTLKAHFRCHLCIPDNLSHFSALS